MKRQAAQKVESMTTEWIWAMTLPAPQASTEQALRLGHRRWDIGNHGFNELANEWHSDPVYKHDARAMESFSLLAFLAYNLFHAFHLLNLKPQIRHHKTQRYWVRLHRLRILSGYSLRQRLVPLSLFRVFCPHLASRPANTHAACGELGPPSRRAGLSRPIFPPCPAKKKRMRICPRTSHSSGFHISAPAQPSMRNRWLGATEVELRVTLSHYIEPNPGERGWLQRHRYPSHNLRFEVKRALESVLDFRARINAAATAEEQGLGAIDVGPDNWFLGRIRNVGSLHSDYWHGTAAELAQRSAIGVYPLVLLR